MKRWIVISLVALVIGFPSVIYLLTDILQGGIARFEKELRKGTVITRAEGHLAATEKSRENLRTMVNEFDVKYRTEFAQIERLEEARKEVVENFEKLAGIAQDAGLPEQNQANDEDKAKRVQIGSRTFTGGEVYDELAKYKRQLKEAKNHIDNGRKVAEHYRSRADIIRSQMSKVDDNIVTIKNDIADLEMYRKLLEANKTLKDAGVGVDKIEELMKSEGIIAELRKETDEAKVRLEISDKEITGSGVGTALSSVPSPTTSTSSPSASSTFSLDGLL